MYHEDSVYLAKQHPRHQNLLFIPLGETLQYMRGTVLHIYCREVCVRMESTTTLPYQFSNNFCPLSLSFPL